MTSYAGNYSGMKDPFVSPALPKTFYHPTRSRGVDTKIAITGPERDDVAQSSDADKYFLDGNGEFVSSHSSKWQRNKSDHQVHHNALHKSDDNFHEIWPESEQPSAISSVQADISPFTSVSAEAERDNAREQSHAEYSKGKYLANEVSTTNRTPVKSVLQKYIDRFRNSEPKSKMEREKEKEANYQDFWWMNSVPPSPADTDFHAQRKASSHMPASAMKKSQAEALYERKLTKEAVMELDQETSKLQKKADQILCRSQLSLASSGPIVSTQGLGSSTTVSEYSFKSDSQVPYRPAFINIKEQHSMLEEEKDVRQDHAAHDIISPPGDILAKWRLRRKMEEAKPHYSKGSAKLLSHQGVFRNKEMNMKLEDFRKKLVSQRALVTQEEIQYEREKMNLLVEEERDNMCSMTQPKGPNVEDRKVQALVNPQADPILMRLKHITGTCGTNTASVSTGLSNVNKENDYQNIRHKENENPGDETAEINSNVNNVCTKTDVEFSALQSSKSTHHSLNRHNTAVPADDGGPISKDIYPIVDQSDSIILCDGKKSGALNQGEEKRENVCSKCKGEDTPISSNALTEEETSNDNLVIKKKELSFEKSRHEEKLSAYEKSESVNSNRDSDESSLQNRQVYHQYLVAEKPSVEVSQRITKSTQLEDEVSSENGQKITKRIRLKKKERREGKSSSHDKRERVKEKTVRDLDQDSSVNEDKESVCSGSSSKSRNLRVQECHSHDEDERFEPHSQTSHKPKDESHSENIINNHGHSPFSREGDPTGDQQRTRVEMVYQSPNRQKIQRAVVQTVADHLFDGPSVISSVDSWASLFPQSPAPSRFVHESDLSSPSPSKGNVPPLQSTPTQTPSLTTVTDIDEVASCESDNEFEDDPLLTLLRQQRLDYMKKLEAIESALINKDR